MKTKVTHTNARAPGLETPSNPHKHGIQSRPFPKKYGDQRYWIYSFLSGMQTKIPTAHVGKKKTAHKK